MSVLGLVSVKMHTLLRDIGLLVLRLGVGLGMAFGHGYGKLMAFNEKAATFSDPLGVGAPTSMALAIFGEFFCALLVALGLFTRAAAVPVVITMLVAFFIVHGADPFPRKEKALLYLVPYVALILTGPGRISLDHLLLPKLFGRGKKAEA